MNQKKLNMNLVMNGIKTLMSILFPFITFPYVTRILSPSSIGEYDYANSIITYFVLIAGLGVSTYTVRSGTYLRDKREEINNFISEVFSLNMISTFVAYLLLAICFIFIDNFREYNISICLFSISIVFKTLGVEWIFSIFEDYRFITIRSIIFQVISILLLFLFVKNEDDLYIYILINVIATVGSNLCNFVYARKYCNLCIRFNKEILKHIKPVFVIFSTSLATIIYINSDTTMLGFLEGTEQVGYYAVATKLYNSIKAMLNSMVPVFMARLAYQYREWREEYNKTFQYAFEMLTFFTIPLAIGTLFYSNEIIRLISGEEYLQAESAMRILFFSLIFATLGNLYSSGGLLLVGKEKGMLYITIFGAFLNVFTNYRMIPILKCTGAAITTLITEVVVFFFIYFLFKKEVKTKVGGIHFIKCMVATIPFGIIKYVFLWKKVDALSVQLIGIFVCMICYIFVLYVLKDNFVITIFKNIKKGKIPGKYN